MKLTKYEIFIKVLEFGSLSRAASSLNYTQSAISQIIQSLEQEFGVTLLYRSRAGVTLTNDGEQLLPYIKEISHAHLRFNVKLSEIQNLDSGIIRIGAFTSVACHLLPSWLKKFKEIYPNITFELKQGDYVETEQWVSEGSVDVGIVRLPSKLMSTPILKDRMMVVLPYDHPLAEQEKIDIKSLEKLPFLMLEPGNNDDLLKLFRQHHVSPKIEYHVRDDYTIMSMIEKGLGISILPELVLKRTPYHIAARELTTPAFRTLGISVKDPYRLSLGARQFIRLIMDTYSLEPNIIEKWHLDYKA